MYIQLLFALLTARIVEWLIVAAVRELREIKFKYESNKMHDQQLNQK